MSKNMIWELVKKYAKSAKIRKNVHPHTFRHSCATSMLKNKADLRTIQKLLGHSSLTSTQIYTHLSITDLKEVHRLCHPREKEKPAMTVDERMYQISCSFPILKQKGVEKGDIPGITSTAFYDEQLADCLYNGYGGALSDGELLILEFLLNSFNPYIHTKFNLGKALHKWDLQHIKAFLEAIIRVYKCE